MFSTILNSRVALLAFFALSAINALPLYDQSIRRPDIAPKPIAPKPLEPRHCDQPAPTPTEASMQPAPTSPPRICPTVVNMGLASSFAGLGASTLTSTGKSVLAGDVGVYPGTSITGFPPGLVSGNTYSAQTQAQNGKSACQTAFDAGHAQAANAKLLETELGGLTLTPGVYKFASTAGLTGTVTLSGSGSDTCGGGQFIFLIPTTLTTAAASKIVLTNGAKACNVYFMIGSSGTVGAASKLKGNFIAYASISAGEAASNEGTFCALTAAVTLINNGLTAQGQCSA